MWNFHNSCRRSFKSPLNTSLNFGCMSLPVSVLPCFTLPDSLAGGSPALVPLIMKCTCSVKGRALALTLLVGSPSGPIWFCVGGRGARGVQEAALVDARPTSRASCRLEHHLAARMCRREAGNFTRSLDTFSPDLLPDRAVPKSLMRIRGSSFESPHSAVIMVGWLRDPLTPCFSCTEMQKRMLNTSSNCASFLWTHSQD